MLNALNDVDDEYLKSSSQAEPLNVSFDRYNHYHSALKLSGMHERS